MSEAIEELQGYQFPYHLYALYSSMESKGDYMR